MARHKMAVRRASVCLMALIGMLTWLQATMALACGSMDFIRLSEYTRIAGEAGASVVRARPTHYEPLGVVLGARAAILTIVVVETYIGDVPSSLSIIVQHPNMGVEPDPVEFFRRLRGSEIVLGITENRSVKLPKPGRHDGTELQYDLPFLFHSGVCSNSFMFSVEQMKKLDQASAEFLQSLKPIKR